MKDTALITGASTGIGATYADRFARRGQDLILVARNRQRLDALARRLTDDTGRSVEVIAADLNNTADLALIEQVLLTDPSISVLVNSAGTGSVASLLESNIDDMERMIDLNVAALVRLTHAVLPTFVKRGSGAIINIASVAGIAHELPLGGVYAGTKAFVLAFSRSLQHELTGSDVRVQVVLPGAIATEFWDVAGTPVETLPRQMVMRVDALVDAAISGFDQGELITIPSLPDMADWEAYETARQRMIPRLSLSHPAVRYGAMASYANIPGAGK